MADKDKSFKTLTKAIDKLEKDLLKVKEEDEAELTTRQRAAYEFALSEMHNTLVKARYLALVNEVEI